MSDTFLSPASGGPEAEDLQVLTFDVGRETLALEAALVQEITDVVAGARVPGASALADQVINHRGRIIPLVDLRVGLGQAEGAGTIDSRIVVIQVRVNDETVLCGLYSDKVHEVRSFPAAVVEDSPAVGLRWPRDMVRRLIRHQGDILILPDIHAILSKIIRGQGIAPSAPTLS